MTTHHVLRAVLLCAALHTPTTTTADDGELMVQAYCSACHSLALVYAQSGDLRFWRATINLMREQHNLGPIPSQTEAEIVSYLADRTVPVPVVRRAVLEEALLPPR